MIKRASIAAVALAAVVALAGCGLVEDKVNEAVDNAVEDGVERALEQGGDVDIEFGENADLPANFPADVPLPDAELTAGVGSADGWWITYNAASASVLDSLYADFESKGWEMTGENTVGDLSQRAYSNGTYDVVVGAVQADGAVQLTIAVTPTAE